LKIKLSPSALEDLESIGSYLDRQNSNLRVKTIKTIKFEIALLAEFPNKGRTGFIPNTRELILSKLPYCVPYRIRKGEIEVIRIYHTSRKPLN